jgi:hypothetical protein
MTHPLYTFNNQHLDIITDHNILIQKRMLNEFLDNLQLVNLLKSFIQKKQYDNVHELSGILKDYAYGCCCYRIGVLFKNIHRDFLFGEGYLNELDAEYELIMDTLGAFLN